jgi:toxin ParE1/3/4
MRLDLVYSGKALGDLESILRHIAEDSPATARLWVAAIEERCEKLRFFPEMGVERPDLAAGLRIFPFRRSVIAYRILLGRIRIVRVLHGGQDYGALVGD